MKLIFRQASLKCAVFTYCDNESTHFFRDKDGVVIGLCDEHVPVANKFRHNPIQASLYELSEEEVAPFLVMES